MLIGYSDGSYRRFNHVRCIGFAFVITDGEGKTLREGWDGDMISPLVQNKSFQAEIRGLRMLLEEFVYCGWNGQEIVVRTDFTFNPRKAKAHGIPVSSFASIKFEQVPRKMNSRANALASLGRQDLERRVP